MRVLRTRGTIALIGLGIAVIQPGLETAVGAPVGSAHYPGGIEAVARASVRLAALLEYSELAGDPPPLALPGDVNGDGRVNGGDIATFVNVMLGTDTSPVHRDASDLNRDGLVNGVDTPLFIGQQLAIAPAGRVLFVDKTLVTTSCTTYNPATRSCGAAGAFTAYKTIAAASSASQPGDTIEVRAGTYAEQLRPATSGADGAPITYHAYQSETVALSAPLAIDLTNRNFIIVDGFSVDNTQWLEADNANNNIVRNNIFTRSPASGTTGNVRFITSSYNKIQNNLIDDGNDNLILIDSDHNLIEGNTIHKARHALWAIKCGNFNIVRNNTFNNPDQKIGEIYDCDDIGAAGIVQYNATKHNLVDGNRFELTSASGDEKNGIQYSAQNGIIRRNVFENNFGGGLGMAGYGGEASYCTSNRIHNNVFYRNSFGGVNFSTFSGTQGTDNLFKNNAFLQNSDGSGTPAQLVLRKLTGYYFEKNVFFNTAPGTQGLLIYDQGSSNCPSGALACWQLNYAGLFFANLEVDPLFANPANHDFHLQAGSTLIDGGAFLTRTTDSGSGTVLPVADASWFCDGFGIPGVVGDTVQLAGQTVTAVVVGIDYNANTVILNQPLAWISNQGVGPPYNGSAPDIGTVDSGSN